MGYPKDWPPSLSNFELVIETYVCFIFCITCSCTAVAWGFVVLQEIEVKVWLQLLYGALSV
jgi:hypothetical protein